MKDLLLIYNARLVDANIDRKKSAILLSGSKIAGFPEKDALKKLLTDDKVAKFNAQGAAVMPGFIDTHAHFRDPGLTQKEDITTGSMAAAAGGYTTCVLMPNTNPVCSSQKMAEENIAKAKEAGFCNVIQSVSITKDFDGKTISHLETLNPKVVPVITEDGKEVMDSGVMFDAMCTAAKKKLIVACHCEDPFLAAKARPYRMDALKIIHGTSAKLSSTEKTKAVNLLKTADALLAQAEDAATLRNIRLAKDAGCHIHLCHVSTEVCVEAAKKAKAEGQKITFEITPHHIGLSGEKAPNIFNLVNPPLRSEKDRQALINALKDGTADCIGTDHAPHTAEDKKIGAPGFSGIETSFAVCNTVLVKENGMSLKQLSKLMSANPAEILGLKNVGLLEEGYDADLTIVDTEKEWKVCGEEFASKGKFTPLEGKKLTGQVVATFLKGNITFQA